MTVQGRDRCNYPMPGEKTCGRPEGHPAKHLSIEAYQKRKTTDHARQYGQRRSFRNVLDQVKIMVGCVDCGYDRYPEALDFDHLPGVTKVSGVSQMLRGDPELIWEEIDKCEVVCSNCHRHRTHQRGQASRKYATIVS